MTRTEMPERISTQAELDDQAARAARARAAAPSARRTTPTAFDLAQRDRAASVPA
jgi:hypothetical protein